MRSEPGEKPGERYGIITLSYLCYCVRCDRWVGAITFGETRSGSDSPVCGVIASARCSVCGLPSAKVNLDFTVGTEDV